MLCKRRAHVDRDITTADALDSMRCVKRRVNDQVYEFIVSALRQHESRSNGYWEIITPPGVRRKYRCSKCQCISPVPNRYCTKCGSEMFSDTTGIIRKKPAGH